MVKPNLAKIDDAQRYCRNLARALLLISLVYVTWRFGGVDAIALIHVSILMIAATCFAILGQPKLGFQAKRQPLFLLSVIGIAVAWPCFQSVHLPQALFDTIATGQHEINSGLVASTTEATGSVLESSPEFTLQSQSEASLPRRSISVVRSLTLARIQQWVLMAAFVFLSALLFDTRDSRRIFLWTLAVNTGLLAIWGLIQRATGSTDLLPGISRSTVLMPFGPFVYKNAGAAALVPGFVAAIALLWPRWLPRYGCVDTKRTSGKRVDKRKADFEYRSTGATDATRNRFLLALVGLGAVAILMSYSRGAWLGAMVAALIVTFTIRRHIPKHVAVLIVGVPTLICLTLMVAPRGINPVVDRIDEQVSKNYIYADLRWDHWRDGMRTVRKYFPLGAGIGTYGYATLGEQKSDSMLWFREAHNHYLETLAEQGLPGLLLLVIAGACILRYSHALLNNQISRERSAIGMAGLASFIAIATQSIFDFVILIPAVMFLFASLFGVVAQSYVLPIRTRRVRAMGEQRPQSSDTERNQLAPAILAFPILVCLIATHAGIRQRAAVEQIIAETRPIHGAVPDLMIIDANIDRLNESITHISGHAELYQRRAFWNTIKLRHGVRQMATQADNVMRWDETSLTELYQRLMSMPDQDRFLVTDDFAIVPALRQPLHQTLADLQTTIELNPFDPQAHQMLALLAPIVELPSASFNDNLCRLAHSNPRMQFVAGLIAHFDDNESRMIEQWRLALRGTCPEFPQIVRLCNRSMSVEKIATELIPTDRAELLLPMVRAFDAPQRDLLLQDPQFIRFVERKVMMDIALPPGRRNALLGWIANELERDQAASRFWELAVLNDKSNVDYRYQYCRSLLKTERFQEVFRQCSLGQSLEPKMDRFQKIAKQARQNMTVEKPNVSNSL